MQKQLLCGVSAVAILVAVDAAALAADMPVKAPPVAVRPLDWNGFYIGGHLGYGQANFGGTIFNNDTSTNVSISDNPGGAGLVGGIHLGQNWQVNTFVYGWEADLSATGWQKHKFRNYGDSEDGIETNVQLLASLRARLGMTFDRTLLYATGGLAYTRARFIVHSSTLDNAAFRGKFSKFGGVVGLGAEWKQSPSFSWRLEGLYYIFDGSKRGTFGDDTPRPANFEFENAWVVRLGATHHFGAGDPPVPVGLPVKAVALATLPMRSWSGFYVGGHLGYGKTNFGGTFTTSIPNEPAGIVGGMHAGQNWQVNTFVYGWEADLSATGWDQHRMFGSSGVETNVRMLASLRARLGLTYDRALFYATGGLAYIRAKAIAHSSSMFVTNFKTTFNKFGGVAGLGVEWKQTPSFSWRLEGLYYHFDASKRGTISVNAVNIKLDDAWVVRVGATHHFATSDIRLKRDIALVSRLDNGLGLYRYRYLWSDEVYVGVMAQEVAEVMPDAVACGADGYLRVDYARLGLRLMTWEEWTGCSRERLAMAA